MRYAKYVSLPRARFFTSCRHARGKSENSRAREIISGARITIEHREPLRGGIRARCIGTGNAESEIPASDGDGE